MDGLKLVLSPGAPCNADNATRDPKPKTKPKAKANELAEVKIMLPARLSLLFEFAVSVFVKLNQNINS